ncbi:hypothetical protein MMC11_004265 [Xylographa trunciseda]|nr:hypothetical protein [Xylographa trunciseda]
MTNHAQRFRKNLADYRIIFDEDVYDEHDEDRQQLPIHVQAVREQLLDITHILPWSAVEKARARGEVNRALLECLPEQRTDEIYFNGMHDANVRSTSVHRCNSVDVHDEGNRLPVYSIQEHETNFIRAMMITEDALRLNSNDGVRESRFTRLLNKRVFPRWLSRGDENEKYDPLDSIVSHTESSLLRHAHNARYQLHHSSSSKEQYSSDISTAKPDWFFAFPIHTDWNDATLTPSRFYDRFSLNKLAELQKSGICSCPIMDLKKHLKTLKKQKRKSARQVQESTKDISCSGGHKTEPATFGGLTDINYNKKVSSNYSLLCYPWAIVELKPPDSANADVLLCYCQAANGASSSLTLLEQLTKHKGEAHPQEPIPPILSISFIGSEVKVWLAYTIISENEFGGEGDSWEDDCWDSVHHSTCIWQGSLKNTLDAVKLCRILDNALFWALRRFRPWLAHHLDASYDRVQAEKLANEPVYTKTYIKNELRQLEERDQETNEREEKLNELEKELKVRERKLNLGDAKLLAGEAKLLAEERELKKRGGNLDERGRMLDEISKELKLREMESNDQSMELMEREESLEERDESLDERDESLEEREKSLDEREKSLDEREKSLKKREKSLKKQKQEMERRSKNAIDSGRDLETRKGEVKDQERQVAELKKQLTEREKILNIAEVKTEEKESEIQQRDDVSTQRAAEIQARNEKSLIEYAAKHIELQHREEVLKKLEQDTEALVTRMYFDVLKLREQKAGAQGSRFPLSMEGKSYQEGQSNLGRSSVFGTPPSISLGKPASGPFTPQSSSNAHSRTTSALDTHPFLLSTSSSGSPRLGPGPETSISQTSISLSKAKSTSNLFDSFSGSEDQTMFSGQSTGKTYGTGTRNSERRKIVPFRSPLNMTGGRSTVPRPVWNTESRFSFDTSLSSKDHSQSVPAKDSGSAGNIERPSTSFDFSPKASNFSSELKPAASVKSPAIRPAIPSSDGSEPSTHADEDGESSKSPGKPR